jgi:hypothetical protein
MDKLKCGQVEAYGVAPGEPIHASIPRLAWETITTLFEFDERVRSLDVGHDGNTLYRNALVDVDAILTSWPPPKSAKSSPNLEHILKQERASRGRDLTQREAEKIALDSNAVENQKKVREVLRSIQGEKKPGPRGPRGRRK